MTVVKPTEPIDKAICGKSWGTSQINQSVYETFPFRLTSTFGWFVVAAIATTPNPTRVVASTVSSGTSTVVACPAYPAVGKETRFLTCDTLIATHAGSTSFGSFIGASSTGE